MLPLIARLSVNAPRDVRPTEGVAYDDVQEREKDEIREKWLNVRDHFAKRNAPKWLLNDRDFMMKAIQYNPDWLFKASDEIQNDPNFWIWAIRIDHSMLRYSSVELRTENHEFAFKAVQVNGLALQWFDTRLFTEDVMMEAIKNNPNVVEFVPDNMKNKLFWLNAVKANYMALKNVPVALDKNEYEEIVLAAITNDEDAAQLVHYEKLSSNNEWRNDPRFWMKAVKANAMALKWTPDFDSNVRKEIEMEAIKQDGFAMMWVSEINQEDKLYVRDAVKLNGNALFYASEELQNNRDMRILAAMTSVHAAKLVLEDMLKDIKRSLKSDEPLTEAIRWLLRTSTRGNQLFKQDKIDALSKLENHELGHEQLLELRDILVNVYDDAAQFLMAKYEDSNDGDFNKLVDELHSIVLDPATGAVKRQYERMQNDGKEEQQSKRVRFNVDAVFARLGISNHTLEVKAAASCDSLLSLKEETLTRRS